MEFNKESNDIFGIEWISLENDLVLLVVRTVVQRLVS